MSGLRFYWVPKEGPNQVRLHFTRCIFGLVQSPFISKEPIDEHPSSCAWKYSAEVAEKQDDLYIHNLYAGGKNFEQVASLKDTAISVFHEVGFKLHKWYSNVSALERKVMVNETDQGFAKQQLGMKLNEPEILGLSWKKDEDLLVVELLSKIKKLTK